MNFLNLITISYICFRLAPFILVCMLSLTSILYQDFKGIIYIGGLLITCMIAIICGNSIPGSWSKTTTLSPNEVCKIITLSDSGPVSIIPLSIITFTYTAGYMGYIIFKYNLALQNIPSLIIFPLLIITDILWQLKNNCSQFNVIFIGTMIGMGGGIAWAAIIDSLKNSRLLYFNGISNAQTCSRPSKQNFKCVTVQS